MDPRDIKFILLPRLLFPNICSFSSCTSAASALSDSTANVPRQIAPEIAYRPFNPANCAKPNFNRGEHRAACLLDNSHGYFISRPRRDHNGPGSSLCVEGANRRLGIELQRDYIVRRSRRKSFRTNITRDAQFESRRGRSKETRCGSVHRDPRSYCVGEITRNLTCVIRSG